MPLRSVGGELPRVGLTPAPRLTLAQEPEFDRFLESEAPEVPQPQAAAPDYAGRASLAALLRADLAEDAAGAYLRELEGRFGPVLQEAPGEELEALWPILSDGAKIILSRGALSSLATQPGRAGRYEARFRRFLTASLPQPQIRALLASLGMEVSASALFVQEDGRMGLLFSGETGRRTMPDPLGSLLRDAAQPLSITGMQTAEIPAAPVSQEPQSAGVLQTGLLVLVSFVEGLLPRRRQGRKRGARRRVEGARPRWLRHRPRR